MSSIGQVITAAVFVAAFGIGLCLTEKRISFRRYRRACFAAMLIWAGLFLYLTVFSRTADPKVKPRLVPFWSYEKAINGLKRGKFKYFRLTLLNILVFMPFGMLIHRVIRRKGWVVLLLSLMAGLCFSTFIEGIQYYFRLGVFEIDDLINNTMGSVLGAGFSMVTCHIIRRIKKSRKETGIS